eukprot:gene3778-2669_t
MASQIGSRIHLTSVSEIRYEGLLHNIDIEGNTVSLTNVRIFGTEGRKHGVDEVPPSNEVFEIIVFRGSDIKDLTLFDEDTKGKPQDPAIVSATRATHTDPVDRQPGSSQHHYGGNNESRRVGRGGARGFYDQPHNDNRRGGGGRGGGHRRNDGGYGGNGRVGGNGGYHRQRQDGHTGKEFRVGGKEAKEEFKEEFDFSRGREEFEKTKKEFEEGKDGKPKAYSKSTGFFDNISCDQKESRMGREEMKKTDTETFGPDMVGNMRNFRRRGRYRR